MLWYDAMLFLLVLGLVPVLWCINHYFRRKSARAAALQESFSRVTATLAEASTASASRRASCGRRRTPGCSANWWPTMPIQLRRHRDAGLLSAAAGPEQPVFRRRAAAGRRLSGARRRREPTWVTLVGFLFMADLFFSPITMLGNQYNQALTAMAGAERVFRCSTRRPTGRDPPNRPWPLEPIRGRVEFRDVSFGYDPSGRCSATSTFVAEPGETVALVGHTGSGKTSIINLIAKFYLPTAGRIAASTATTFAGSRPIRCTGRSASCCKTISCSAARCSTTSASASPRRPSREVLDAVRRLDCLDLIEALPDGLETASRRARHQPLARPAAAVCFARAHAGRPADPDSRRGHQQRRHDHRSPHPAGAGALLPGAPASSWPIG